MSEKQMRPYGSWRSPITSDLIISGTIGLGDLAISGDDIYWVESRPSERGRSVVVRRKPDGSIADITPLAFNVRSRVHEYGGGAFMVSGDAVYFSNFSDNRLYRQIDGSSPEPITAPGQVRYADMVFDPLRDRIICVCEDHTDREREPINKLITIAADGTGAIVDLVSGAHFYSTPRLRSDGRRLAWLSWNHPNMPWDGSELWVGRIDGGGSVIEARLVAGGPTESIFEPEWSPDGRLYFVSDRTGWWNIYREAGGSVEPVCQMDAEFGAPQWVMGMTLYGFQSTDRIICAYDQMGDWRLGAIDVSLDVAARHELTPIASPYTDIRSLRVTSGRVIIVAGSPGEPVSVVAYDLVSETLDVLRRSSALRIDPDYLSIPQPIEFPTENGLTACAFYYAPNNRDFTGGPDDLPPLMVLSHGGPTSAAVTTLSLNIQYWTSRGLAVLDVNYGGSSGYGREYRQRLNGNWGIVDVDDCVNGARFLVARGLVDARRLIIRGGSAGGYTTLAALTFRDVFKVGASYYGISDLDALEQDGHKFESRYNNSLVGPYPERIELNKQRSPIHFLDRLSCPIILFQGLDDKVVPPNQAEMMFEAALKKGLPVAYVPFEGEGHGFRRAENIKRALDSELFFYSKVFNFELADPVEPVKIENLN
jgi:dienelactone hydrolase